MAGNLPWKTSCFLALERALLLAQTAAAALYRGFWLGVMDECDLYAVTEHYFSTNPLYRGATYDRSGLTPWERDLIIRYFGGARRLLVGACGGGREALALAERGFEVDAFDCNRQLVDVCERLLVRPGCHVMYAAPDSLPPDLGTYEGFLLGWAAYSYIPRRARRVALLHDLRSHLVPEAPVLLSFMTRTEQSRMFRIMHAVAGLIRRARFAAPVELGDNLEEKFVHHFTRAEIEAELCEAGFRPEHYSDDFCGVAVARASSGATEPLPATEEALHRS